MGRRYVYSPLTPISDRIEVSHRAGWALYWAEELGAELITTSRMVGFTAKPGDEVYVYHGMEFKGKAVNFPGGPPASLPKRIDAMIKLAPYMVSMDREMPSYSEILQDAAITPDQRKKLAKVEEDIPFRLWPTDNPEILVIGDSHSLSRYRKGVRIYRHDSKTLHGALEIGLETLLNESFTTGVKEVEFYFGNIDIRHHLCRFGPKTTQDLMREYRKQIKALVATYPKVTFSVVEPLPIENEERKLPQSGWYKGTPFFGTWIMRRDVRQQILDEMDRWRRKDGLMIRRHPAHFWNERGELSFDVMEKPQSVHIRRRSIFIFWEAINGRLSRNNQTARCLESPVEECDAGCQTGRRFRASANTVFC